MKKQSVILLLSLGLVAGCNQSIEKASENFNTLPAPVQKTVRAQAPNAEIASVSHTRNNGQDAYEVTFREEGKSPKIVVAPDGTLLQTELARQPGAVEKALTPTGATGTPFSALPEKVQRTIQAHAPATAISGVSRHEKDGRVIYEVEFSDKGKNPTIRVAEDGTLVQDLAK